jgi:hypothetical protein
LRAVRRRATVVWLVVVFDSLGVVAVVVWFTIDCPRSSN